MVGFWCAQRRLLLADFGRGGFSARRCCMFWCCCRWLPLRLLIWQRKLLGGSVLGDLGTFYIALEGVDANSVSDFVAEEVSV